jgi:hypothetical protein
MMQYSIKPLQWEETSEDTFVAKSPAGNSFHGDLMYTYEQGKYWPVWDLTLPGYDTREEVEVVGQQFHDTFVRDFIVRYTNEE